MEDHHVDRPDVDAQQCVKLTGTNRSFDLIALVAKARARAKARSENRRRMTEIRGQTTNLSSDPSSAARNPVLLRSDDGRQMTDDKVPICPPFFAGLVALARRKRPDPIPNSAVKRLSADGTLSQDTGE